MIGPEQEGGALERTPDKFTILVIEDNERLRADIAKRLRRNSDVTVIEASTKAEAIAAMKAHYIDAATVDIRLHEVDTAGLDVLIHLGQRCPNCSVVIATQYVRSNQGEILTEYIGATRPRIVKIVDKSKETFRDAIADALEEALDGWRSNRVRLENEELPLRLLWKRKGREGLKGRLREDQTELRIEFDRACRKLFGGVQRLADTAEATVCFEPIEREGMSSALTVKASVRLGTDVAGNPVNGSQCVLKVGPLDDIEEEVRRYHRFVKFGVRLAERVEMLADTLQDGFGAVAYSFAGGVFGEDLLTLDELFRSDAGWALAEKSIYTLLKPSNRNWYGVECEEEPPRVFASDEKFEESYEFLHNSLSNLKGQFREHGYALKEATDDEDGYFEFFGGKLTIPTMRIRGTDPITPSRPQCFVHGDMHGGNVMVELGSNGGDDGFGNRQLALRRVCLIDYRRSGMGPRPIDAVALQASLRLADAQAICDEITGEQDSKPTDEQLSAAVLKAARRSFAEERLLEEVWSKPPPERVELSATPSWQSTAKLIAELMRMNFKTITQEEYLAIAVLCGIRQFAYPMETVAKVRMLAWVSTMWGALQGEASSDDRIEEPDAG